MNKVILMGRLTAAPELRYSQGAEPVAVLRFSVAIDRRFKHEGEETVDFINCVTFGKNAEFISKYFKKGMMISLVGRLQVRNWQDNAGQKRVSTEVVVEEQYFAESKAAYEARMANKSASSNAYQPSNAYQQQEQAAPPSASSQPDGFYSIDDSIDDDDLPF